MSKFGKASMFFMAAGISAALFCGCGNKGADSTAAAATTAAATTAAETTAAATTAAQTTAAETTAAATTAAATTEAADDETETVIESITTYENAVFSISYPEGLFEEGDVTDGNGVCFDYKGEAAHPVYILISYYEETPENVRKLAEEVEGRTIVLDEMMKTPFYDEEVPEIVETAEEDGYTSTLTCFIVPYGDGTMTVCAGSYKEANEELSQEISDAVSNCIDTLQFKF